MARQVMELSVGAIEPETILFGADLVCLAALETRERLRAASFSVVFALGVRANARRSQLQLVLAGQQMPQLKIRTGQF